MKFATQIDIADAINENITNENMFTAYDITKTLRHCGYHVRHSEVRDAVRDYDFPYEYREGVDSSIGAIVHYHMDYDVNDYNPNKVPEFVPNHSGVSGTKIKVTSTTIVDKRQRFCVPATKLRDAGFIKGMHVKILIEHDKIVIHSGNDGVEVTVDKSNNIRIAKGTLQNAFDTMPSKINIDVSVGRVELSTDD